MSQTPLTVTYTLEEVLTEITRKLDTLQKDLNDSRLETKVAIQELKSEINESRLETKVAIEGLRNETKVAIEELKTETKVASQELKGEIKSLDEKLNGLGKHLENQEFVNRGILVALVVAIVGGVAKLFGWVGNP
jgi:uncharacterized protein (DUF3084 family)